jgi:hypothetical protein
MQIKVVKIKTIHIIRGVTDLTGTETGIIIGTTEKDKNKLWDRLRKVIDPSPITSRGTEIVGNIIVSVNVNAKDKGNSAGRVEQWVKEIGKGMIKDIIETVDSTTMKVLINPTSLPRKSTRTTVCHLIISLL